jgi:hypothetical protein
MQEPHLPRQGGLAGMQGPANQLTLSVLDDVANLVPG